MVGTFDTLASILGINAGSLSIKCVLFHVRQPIMPISWSRIEQIGIKDSIMTVADRSAIQSSSHNPCVLRGWTA